MVRDDDMDDHSDSATSPTSPTVAKDAYRKRSSRACDQCRKAKSRCDPSDEGPCKSCQVSGTTCTFQGPSQKRGPPKGYLQDLENRLHEAEALLGAIISSSQAEPLVAILSKDPLAEKIITRVNNSVFGALGRPRGNKPQSGPLRGRRRPDKEQQRMSNGQLVYSRESGNPVFTSPSYAWQDHLNKQLAGRPLHDSTSCSQAATLNEDGSNATSSQYDRRQRRQKDFTENLRLELPRLSEPSLYTEPSEAAVDLHHDLGIGQLSVDSHQQVRYHGEASGLTLLGQIPRADALYHQQIWRLPQMHLSHFGADTRQVTYEDLERDTFLPARSVQEHLLQQYFHYVHPILPIVNHDDLWDEWTSMHKFGSGGPTKLLLLAMFALAARYTNPESPDPMMNQDLSMSGDNYFQIAKSLLSKTYNSSRLSTCQALLLLGYREIGLSGMAGAALFTVMAIKMAQDLGLNRHADHWAREGACVFSLRRLQLRRSVWYGCIVLDSYVAAQSGRPLHIRNEDYDAQLPDIDTQEDFQLWMPYRSAPASGYNPLPGRITSCFRSLCSLAQIVATILHKFYAVNPDLNATQRDAGYLEIDQKLQQWYMELPDFLRFTTAPVPPPQILCLHMFYWCAVSLLQRTTTGIQLQSHDPQSPSRRALDLSATAANSLTDIAHTYNTAFGLRHCPTFLSYYLMIAGVMHISILRVHPSDIRARHGLSRCLQSLEDMKDVWPAASQIYVFLRGADVSGRGQSPAMPIKQPRKRSLLDESSSESTETSIRSRPSPSLPASVASGFLQPTSYMELTHSLGLEPSGMDDVLGSSGYPTSTWPSGNVSLRDM